MTYSALKIVNWLRVRNNAELRLDPNAEELTQMKAMKLLYYIQAASLAVTGRRLFASDIVASKYGPVVTEVKKYYQNKRGIVGDITIDQRAVQDYKELQSDQMAADIIGSVYDLYGHRSAYDLLESIQSEALWENIDLGQVISAEDMRSYYSEIFVLDEKTKQYI